MYVHIYVYYSSRSFKVCTHSRKYTSHMYVLYSTQCMLVIGCLYVCLCLSGHQDHGYPQGTSTEMLKSYIYNEPVAVEKTFSSSKVVCAVYHVGHVYVLCTYVCAFVVCLQFRKLRTPFLALPLSDPYHPLWRTRYVIHTYSTVQLCAYIHVLV